MKLFEPITLRNVTIKNRLVMAPMCMYMATEAGRVQSFHIAHYVNRAIGGVGLIIEEATAVEPRGRITEHDLGIWDNLQIPGLKRLVSAVHAAGAKIGIQLGHAGRKGMAPADPIIAPSDLSYSTDYRTPITMSKGDIATVVEAFRSAAKRAKSAGYDVIELHGAHGYLINQFLSPLSNKRTDEYGGSLENRMRFLQEIIAAVRTVWNGPLLVRLSAEEYARGGNHLEDTVAMLAKLGHDIDAIDVSSGGVVTFKMSVFPGYQIPLSKRIREAGFVTIGGGLITTAEHMEQILDAGDADMVFLGRELLRNPYVMLAAAKKAGRDDLVFKAYERGF